MSTVGQFDTQSVCLWNNPQLDTFAQVDFPRPFVAPPRLPIGLRQLDIGNNADIRAKATTENITKISATYLITSYQWADTTNYGGISNSRASTLSAHSSPLPRSQSSSTTSISTKTTTGVSRPLPRT